jgi:putative membrane protein
MANRNFLQYFIITLKGMAMGVAELVPGVSGGTIAFVTGIYEEFIASINNVNLTTFKVLKKEGFQPFWKALNGNFLVALFGGMLMSIVLFSSLIKWLFEFHTIAIWSFFFGLVLASILIVGKEIKKWTPISIILLIVSAAAAYFITTLPPSANSESLPYLFMSGAIAICAMILPGISGAFILVLLGSYQTVLEAVHERDFKIIITVGLGCLVGILSFARLLKWMFNNHKNITLVVLTGFIAGSLNKIWPWKETIGTLKFGDKIKPIEESILPFAYDGDPQLTYAIIAAIIGFSLIFILEKVASKE